MDIFKGFGKSLTDTVKNVGKKTADATEVAKLNNRISAKEAEREDLYRQIGKAYYGMRDLGGAGEAVEQLCLRVGKLSAEMTELQEKIDQIRQVIRCPGCGAIQPDGASFCATCGTKLPKRPAPAPAVEDMPYAAEPAPEKPRGYVIDWPEPTAETAEAEESDAEEESAEKLDIEAAEGEGEDETDPNDRQ